MDGCLILVGFQLNSSDRILDVDPIPGVGKPKGAAKEGSQETGEKLRVMVIAPSGAAALALRPPVSGTIRKDFRFRCLSSLDFLLVKVRRLLVFSVTRR